MADCPDVNIIPRSEWGARNPVAGLTNLTLPVKYMVYTHTFGEPCNNPTSCSSIVREIQNFHMNSPNNFADIGYNFLIGGDGSIFEGRGWHTKGAYNPDYNSKGFGTALIGRFPPEGNYFSDLSYAAAKSANGLYKCALSKGYISPANDSAVITSRINPVIREYVLNPDVLMPTTTTTTSTTTTTILFNTTNTIVSPTTSTTPVLTDGVIAAIATGVAIPLLLAVLFIVLICKRRNKLKTTEDYRAAIQKLIPQTTMAYYERPRWSVDLRDVCLGTGQYGQVFKGSLMDRKPSKTLGPTLSGCRPVAVKMLRESCCDYQGTAGFLAEMSILMKVGRHVNIVNLEGVVLRGKLMMVMEHCELGSLDAYLRKLKEDTFAPPLDVNNLVRLANSYVAFGVGDKPQATVATGSGPDVSELTNIAYQVSRGMEFLSSKHVIHRDLAARNVLLTADKTAKIADFGMAREQPEYILEREKVPLPVCWMAPESIIPGRGIFHIPSDVWSFGVVLWEIFSLGETPYAMEFPNGILYAQLCTFLQEGNRLQTPDLCPEPVALLMVKCWDFQSDSRPDFFELRKGLEALLPVADRARYVLFDEENEKLNSCLKCPAEDSGCASETASSYISSTVVAMQKSHVDGNQWVDIGYNFVIGGDGSIFEGRGWHNKGSVAKQYNSIGIGIGLIGRLKTNGSENHGFLYAAAKAANGLFYCARGKAYINQTADGAVVAYDINPLIKDFILDPDAMLTTTFPPPSPTLPPDQSITTLPTTTSASTSQSSSVSPGSRGSTTSAFTTTEASAIPGEIVAGIAAGFGGLILLFAVLGILFYKRRLRLKTNDYRPAIRKLIPENVIAYYELPRWSVELRDVCLGEGQYGKVYKGMLLDNKSRNVQRRRSSESRSVAVKMLHKLRHDDHRHAGFIAEMGILMKVGRHVNIVNLEGLVLKGKLLMVMEHCELGSLERYLQRLKVEAADVPIAELTNMAHQVSRGMEFLASKNVIHRDLAARNILLNASKTVKIADFGMAREQPAYILEREKVPLPVCWMAPESIIPGRGIFTTLSDVWSFGVVLWEIFTLGGVPYASEFPNGIFYTQFCLFLQEGQRLSTPELCPESFAILMMNCWHFHAEDRPNFSSLRQSIEALLPAIERAQYIAFDTENEALNNCLNNPADCSSSSTSSSSTSSSSQTIAKM
ncbi:uncharacterized protein LOC129596353 isoform X2 [Paramacrobiotus metropolitanus]|uniref:uncharacterized protein LOC129596353 isoform X2 n=1 Tax=Paramacrobiotus metropolitanus TaxID=2943436 RepID=UPI002445F8CA|nr:uncharacterized protein LOC129596353 isoform X2 [Paramacrobiotus metropolitanus]